MALRRRARDLLGSYGAGLLVALLPACAPTLSWRVEASSGEVPSPSQTAAELLRQADAAWARRADPAEVVTAQRRYLEAARVDRHSVAGLLGAAWAMSFRLEHGTVPGLADEGVQVARWCQLRAPEQPACRYWLAVAIGHQLRERPATGWTRVGEMADLLHDVVEKAPALDEGGPHRLLALVLLRAPGQPLGLGDPEAALAEARAAVEASPDSAANRLVLSMALARARQCGAARAAYWQARAVALAEGERGARGVARLLADAEAGLESCSAP